MNVKRHAGLRRFNRNVFNRVTKLFAGRFFYALVVHQGRVSGKAYATPVVAAQKDGLIFIPLPYGSDTDWLLNVQAAGGCKVKMQGKIYETDNPEVVDAATALPNFSASLQKAFLKAKITQYLRLKVSPQ
jgi:deazaflavin-dependent oxidoreductase (nitroreductase family)